MANRVFQNVVYQMKDAVDRVVGVIDKTGTVISCSELGQIGAELSLLDGTNDFTHFIGLLPS